MLHEQPLPLSSPVALHPIVIEQGVIWKVVVDYGSMRPPEQQELFEGVPTELVRSIDLGPDCPCSLISHVVPDHEALRDALVADLPWMQEIYRPFGRSVPAPRWTSYHGDPGATYRYSGIVQEPHPFTPLLSNLRAVVSSRVGVPFNAVLINYYRGGSDGMGYHADGEAELGPSHEDVAIACLSLGATRRFVFKPRKGKGSVLTVMLEGGALLVMRGMIQRRWLHALPKTRRSVSSRVSLTFRLVAPAPLAGDR